MPGREPIKAVVAKLKLVRMRRANRRNQRDRKLRRVVARAIRDAEAQPTQRDAAIFAVRRCDWSERGRLNLHTRDCRPVEPCQHRVRIEPGSANHLKRPARSSTHRYVCPLEKAYARIMKCALEVRHIGRRFDPGNARLVIEHGSRPAGHRDDHEVGTDPQNIVRHASELAECHPVTHRDGKKTNKGGVRIARLHAHVSLHGKAADGIRPIQHDHALVRVRCAAHHLRERRGIGVIARADVLEIDQHHVGAIECSPGSGARSTIETVDWEAGDRVSAVGKSGAVLGAAEAVFGTEQHRESSVVRRAQQIDITATEMIDPRVIREETEAFAGDQVSGVRQQHFNARTHRRGGRGNA